jgi:hypothetical protein
MMLTVPMVLGEGEQAAGPWQVVSLAALAAMLAPRERVPAGRPWILAVDGRSGSGKTTLARRIRDQVPASALVHTDDIAWNQAMFDWAGLLAHGVLEPARRGEAVSFRPPAWRERGRVGAIEVPQDLDLLIVEGAGAARRELMHLIDAAAWVQADMAEAERRGIERDGGDAEAVAFWNEWMAEELPFMARERPWMRADVIVAGSPDFPYDTAREAVIARPSELRRASL